MEELANGVCTACRQGAARATAEEIEAWLAQVPAWKVHEVDGIDRLERSYVFADFVQALDFTGRVGGIAEEHGHHPALLTEWGRVTVSWWTHKIGGLHRNDFIMAARTDRLLE